MYICGICTHVFSCVQFFVIPWTAACQAPLSMAFPRQEYWSRLPVPSPGDCPDPGIEPVSPTSSALIGGFFTTEPPGDGLPYSSSGKESTCNAGDPSLIPGSGRSTEEGNSYLLQYSGLKNSMDCIVHGIAKRHN